MPLRVAYLVNQYPKVSHSFIRREILALERRGVTVQRMAIRGWDADVVDDDDLRERDATQYVLERGWWTLAAALVALLLRAPSNFFAALNLATRMGGRRADRPLPFHWIYLAEACVVARWMQRAGAVHLHAHFGTNSAEVAMLVNVLQATPYSFTVHGPEEFDRPEAIGLAEKTRRAAFVVAISSYGRSQLYRWTARSDWHKIHVVHCALDAAYFDDTQVAPQAARQLVCVGRLCEQKGQLLLLQAMRQVLDHGIDFELVLAGDGEMRADIDTAVDAMGLRERVRITGWISGAQVREEILAARAMVLPSFAEGLPVVIMEAMALRRPVLSTYVAGIPELVLPGECGWLFPAGDVGSLAAAIEACLAASPDQLDAMGQAGHRRAFARHAIDAQAARLQRLMTPAKAH